MTERGRERRLQSMLGYAEVRLNSVFLIWLSRRTSASSWVSASICAESSSFFLLYSTSFCTKDT